MIPADVLETFICEARELLSAMEAELLLFEQGAETSDSINAIFRAAHTIKGSAGLFGFSNIMSITHVVETLLDRIRNGAIPMNPELLSLLLECRDHIGALVDDATANNNENPPELKARTETLLSNLNAALGGVLAVGHSSGNPLLALSSHATPQTSDATSDASITSAEAWHISIRYRDSVLKDGNDPLAQLCYLAGMGEIISVQIVDDGLPPANQFEPESCYVGFEIGYRSDCGKDRIESAFEFVRDNCTLTILPPRARVADFVRLIHDLPEGNVRLGELLVQCGSITDAELKEALQRQHEISKGEPAAAPALGELLVQQKVVQAPIVEAALEKQRKAKEKLTEPRSLRVDADKLDRLIDLVGELIIAGASSQVVAQKHALADLAESISIMSRLVAEVRDQSLNLRMVPIGLTFSKLQRAVRDLSRELHKSVVLEINGEEAELDKALVEQIGDVLMHLVRNALDHGIEPSEVRAERGKSAQAVVALNAYHESGAVIIEVSDDGGGLPRDKILARAISKGLISESASPSDSEIFAKIFEPGFSTAEQVTNVSGRGVGMDVVRRNVSALRGTVEVDSKDGVGTTVRLRLPLTLAIIDGFLIRVGVSAFVIPLDLVEECLEMNELEECVAGGHRYLDLRGTALPFMRLGELFDIGDRGSRRESVVVVRSGNRRAGFVVDELLGEMQAVIKPLTRTLGPLRGVAGSTILGDGTIAFVLEVPALIHQMSAGGSLELQRSLHGRHSAKDSIPILD